MTPADAVRRLAAPDHLIALRCDGQRCRALRELGCDPGDGTAPDPLRAAVAGRPDAILVATPCLGACAAATIVAVGRGHVVPRLTWHGPPVWLQCALGRDEAPRVAAWVAAGARPTDAPVGLRFDPALIPGWGAA